MDRELLRALEARLGPLEPGGLEAGEQGRVWSARTRSGRVAVKRCADDASFRRECRAHRQLQAHPELATRVVRPRFVLAAWRTIVMDFVDGVSPRGPAAHAALGELVADLREATRGGGDDPLPLPEALEQRLEAAMQAVGSRLSVDEVVRVEQSVRPEAFRDEVRSLCHRDVRPDNAVVRPDGSVCLLDLGQARFDHWLADVVKIWVDANVSATDRTAFARAAGVTDRDQPRLETLVTLHALGTMAWGLQHGDETRVEAGRALLRS